MNIKFRPVEDKMFPPKVCLRYDVNRVPMYSSKNTTSKIGGFPYMPKGFVVPQHKGLLCQINFEEIKPFLKDFPTKGILQIFVPTFEGDMLGLNFENIEESNIEVNYFEEITEDIPQEYHNDSELIMPLGYEYEVKFNETTTASYPTTYDLIELENLHTEIDKVIEDNKLEVSADEITEEMIKKYQEKQSHNCCLGGYPYYTQSDVRQYVNKAEDLIVLFQLDSITSKESKGEVNIGDTGVINVWIRREDLINKDFSKVFINWDCC